MGGTSEVEVVEVVEVEVAIVAGDDGGGVVDFASAAFEADAAAAASLPAALATVEDERDDPMTRKEEKDKLARASIEPCGAFDEKGKKCFCSLFLFAVEEASES